MLNDLLDRWNRVKHGSFLIAVVYAGLGDRERSFEWLNRSVDEASLNSQLSWHLFDDLKADPRYEQFMQRVGIQKR